LLPFIDDRATSLVTLTKGWYEDTHLVGCLIFPQCHHTSPDARLWAALAAEMGANPGNWVRDREDTIQQPATEFGVARKFAYQRSQAGRDALPETAYERVFETGNIDPELGEMLNARRVKKQREGHVDSAPE
jgi:hypothetical protein